MQLPRAFILSSLLTLASLPAHGDSPISLTLKTLTAQMKFDQAELSVTPGSKVKLTFENPDDMPHNVVFCQPGTDVEKLVMKMLEKPEEAIKRNFLPEDPAVWLNSRLLNPHEKQELEFTAPAKAGKYPFVCSFPGHALTMKGTLNVLSEGPILEELHFALYHGDWMKLPDFRTLTPHREGPVPDNLIQLNFDDYKNQYGLVFTGKLKVQTAGEYTFLMASDDGARLLLDDELILVDDGIHPARTKEKKKKLKAGPHTLRVEYFQAAGQAALFVAWKGDSFDTTALSKWKPADWKLPVSQKKDDFTGIPLEPKDAPVLYRNFIEGVGNRAIGVGFPGGLNFAWSAETMNLTLMWRGAFIDAARHWRNRGGGHQPPAGFDVLRPTDLVSPLAILASPDSVWPSYVSDERLPDYAWKGYTLDAKGVPTFHYTWNGIAVEDHLEAQGDFKSPTSKLVRTLHLKGSIPPNTFLLLAREATLQPNAGGFAVVGKKFNFGAQNFDNHVQIEAAGALLSGANLLLPAKQEMQIHYSWPLPHPSSPSVQAPQ